MYPCFNPLSLFKDAYPTRNLHSPMPNCLEDLKNISQYPLRTEHHVIVPICATGVLQKLRLLEPMAHRL